MPEEIRAELFANVWKIVASVGDELDPGDAVAILESMKMEIPAITEDGGTVSKIAVSEGDVVQEGGLIAIIEEFGMVVEPGPGVEQAVGAESVAASEKHERR